MFSDTVFESVFATKLIFAIVDYLPLFSRKTAWKLTSPLEFKKLWH